MTLQKYVSQHRGRQVMLALALEVSPSLVSMWVTGARRVPYHRCLEIERATKGLVRAGGLRRDLSFQRRPHR
jgi:DNA-binding transcriptional regulator YdaS (Cro superfamily)